MQLYPKLEAKKRRLRILGEQRARQSDYTPPHVIIEIEGLRRAIAEAEGE